ncbi:MAG: Primosomal protein C-terminal domain, partial [Verrucomicrobiota bacterium]
NEDKVKLFAEHLRKALDAGLKGWKDLILAGPAPAPLLKAESFFRHQIMLRTSAMSRLSTELAKIEQAFALPADLSLIIDIDPVNLG